MIGFLHSKVSEFGYPLKFEVFGFYTLTFQNLDFTPYILEVFGFYSLKFWCVWILYPKVSEFWDVKSKQP